MNNNTHHLIKHRNIDMTKHISFNKAKKDSKRKCLTWAIQYAISRYWTWQHVTRIKDTLTLRFRALCCSHGNGPLDHVTKFKDTLTLRFRAYSVLLNLPRSEQYSQVICISFYQHDSLTVMSPVVGFLHYLSQESPPFTTDSRSSSPHRSQLHLLHSSAILFFFILCSNFLPSAHIPVSLS
jgi:hypothetical protein